MKIIITTLSFGENYTKEYTLRMIEDVLTLTDLDLYITTDCKNIIFDHFGSSDRIKLNEVTRDKLLVSLPIGPNKGARDFNFNMRVLCLEHVMDIEDAVIIFTDCDNSFDFWDRSWVESFIQDKLKDGYDYFAPRTSAKLKYMIQEFNTNCKTDPNFENMGQGCTLAWHKFYNYDLIDKTTKMVSEDTISKWGDASFPSEYLVIFYNRDGKLKKMVTQWKWFYDYLNNKDYTYGTWAEGFEIGISSLVAGFNDFDIGYGNTTWGKIFTPNGYKTGPRAGRVFATEK